MRVLVFAALIANGGVGVESSSRRAWAGGVCFFALAVATVARAVPCASRSFPPHRPHARDLQSHPHCQCLLCDLLARICAGITTTTTFPCICIFRFFLLALYIYYSPCA